MSEQEEISPERFWRDPLYIHTDNPRSLKAWLLDLGEVLKNNLPVILMVLTGFVLFVRLEQSLDVIRTLFEDLHLTNSAENQFHTFWLFMVFELFIFFWAIQIWMGGRYLLYYADVSYRDFIRSLKFQRWVPRILGCSAFLISTMAFYVSDRLERYNPWEAYLTNTILCALFLYFVIRRRKFFTRYILELTAGSHGINRRGMKGIFWKRRYHMIMILSFFFLFSLFLISPVLLPRFFGAAAIVASSLAFWTSTIVLLGDLDRTRIVPLVWLVMGVSLFSYINNNHGVRLVEPPAAIPRSRLGSEEKLHLNNYFKNWYRYQQEHPCQVERKAFKSKRTGPRGIRAKDTGYPVFIVAAEGGGIRSAYWTALFLSRVQKERPCFYKHLFALSSVSGGSLGSAVYTSLVREYINRQRSENFDFITHARELLSEDFLSPVTGGFAYQDTFQRILPLPINYLDRARPLELSFENSWEKSFGQDSPNPFRSPLYGLWWDKNKTMGNDDDDSDDSILYDVPSLFLNATHVESGKRAIFSNLLFQDHFSDAIDMEDTLGQSSRMRISTAVLLSSRYPVVTPGGRFYRNPDLLFRDFRSSGEKSNVWGHIVDGGYFENSGTATVFDILTDLNEADAGRDVNFHVIILRNDEKESSQTKDPNDHEVERLYFEITQPIMTLLNTGAARIPYSVAVLKKHLGENHVEEINMDLDPTEVPLGWYLSISSRRRVDTFMEDLFSGRGSPENGENLRRIFRELDPSRKR